MSQGYFEQYEIDKLQIPDPSGNPHIFKAQDKRTIVAATSSLKARTKKRRNNDTEDKVKHMVGRFLYYY